MKIFALKKKVLYVGLVCFLCIATCSATFFSISTGAVPKTTHTIVIDAGHGGLDVK